MAKYDVSPFRASLLSDATALAKLPPQLLRVIRDQNPTNLLEAVSQAALKQHLTGPIFAHFEPVFADICARWVLNTPHGSFDSHIIAAFARILPFAPQLSVILEKYLHSLSPTNQPSEEGSATTLLDFSQSLKALGQDALLRTLLSIWRLLNFDCLTFSSLVLPSDIQHFFSHTYGPVKYLAIRIFCLLLSASDHRLEILIQHHFPQAEVAPLIGDFDGKPIDYAFLSLFEHERAEELHNQTIAARNRMQEFPPSNISPQVLTSAVVTYGTTVLPRFNDVPSKKSSLIATHTTVSNLERLAKLLQKPGPILLHGSSGAGKTAIVLELARELAMDSSLVTLYLNEQTDAKMLVGLYTTGTKPGTFEWRPGILTTAVKEGRWVLIEDLDRAPTEIMSTLLPLIERGELLIPNRGERIQAPSSFRILATVRTSRGINGQESIPSLLGLRFWQLLSVQHMLQNELQEVICKKYPLLDRFVLDPILGVFERICLLLRSPSLIPGVSSASERAVSIRDLFKWCRRLERIMSLSGAKTGCEPLSESTYDAMFQEAIDCFASSMKDSQVRNRLILHIGELMGRSSQRVEHHLSSYIPRLDDAGAFLMVGRSKLRKTKRWNRVVKSSRPFAPTTHAKKLLEQISVAVDLKEPVLLVGETGIGKTAAVQQLAERLGHKLIAVNLSQQSEVSDLLGGYKPINVRNLAVPLKEEFEDLFASTRISEEKNQKYLKLISKSIAKGKWSDATRLWKQAPKIFEEILNEKIARETRFQDEQPAKRRKTGSTRLGSLLELKPRWAKFSETLDQFEIQLSRGSGRFAFAFVEGKIVKAVRNGDWVLLDEMNLASPDTLECIADLLQTEPESKPFILLSEAGMIERVKAHPNFRIFGAMNPATDVGKRDLPPGLRSRFTELYVSSPDKDFKDLITIVKSFLNGQSSRVDQAADKVANLYMRIKELADAKALVDGANEVPHFSLRTLTRVLTYVNDVAPYYGLERSLYEGFCMGFLTVLSQDSEKLVVPLIVQHLFGENPHRLLSKPAKYPGDGREYIKFTDKDLSRVYWLPKGSQPPKEREDYIRTPYVERNLLNLVRATSTRRFPILIQGPTSAGKTSMIEYLAEYSGNKFVRINNHEHTDLQEYLGTYMTGPDGNLRFQEGLLVQAMRQGHWIVLDELNLAPTDILEALNRLLDDNRELLIPETQEVVSPHANFMLFATQNPPGLYGGRKVLSRAFRNRFLELHYDDIPEDDLEHILQERSINTAPSDCKRIVSVYKELTRLRQTSRVFEQKGSFATLRDLFRWALRDAETRQDIANNGFMLLAERVRNDEERDAVRQVIETVFKLSISPDQLYDEKFTQAMRRTGLEKNSQGIVWTNAMRRLYTLVSLALRNNEPVLLVGETGCGKTTICQFLSESFGKQLHIVNAQQNTETADLIGSQRPVRNRGAIAEHLKQSLEELFEQLGQPVSGSIDDMLKQYHRLPGRTMAQIPESLREKILANEIRTKALFEWSDGSLIHAMKNARFFLFDEISLADDSVLERLNSVLEPGRSLLLAERGADNSFVQATDGFQFFATMNPGGDFGKKELSPSLRNRFTEIWVPNLSNRQDVLDIVVDKLKPVFKPLAHVIVDFSYWFGQRCRSLTATPFSIRDILVWVSFVNHAEEMQPDLALLHGAATVFIDTLGANPSALLALDPKTIDERRQECLDRLNELIGNGTNVTPIYKEIPRLVVSKGFIRIGDFSIDRLFGAEEDSAFALEAPTTKMNLMRVIRALRVNKPILLEGNPGVGKTTLVSSLARACGRPLTRINLSDQTDLMDLFGTDVPVEGAEAGNFVWRDAPFLQALQKGEWVLLDEMNLASQPVLEGLNACLDHRGEVYISELDQVFKCHPDFRLYAAQNPHSQGGDRKGLPSSFVNRFIVVHADVFTEQDLMLITGKRYPHLSPEMIQKMIKFVSALDFETSISKSFGSIGSPWEFNLRDSLRWLALLASEDPLLASAKASDFLDIIVKQRFRSAADRQRVAQLFTKIFGTSPQQHSLYNTVSSTICQVGLAMLDRNVLLKPNRFPGIDIVPQLGEIESLLICVKQNLPSILVGPSGSGKSSLLKHIAASVGKELVVFPMNADVDAMDLVGGFEQADPLRDLHDRLDDLRHALLEFSLSKSPDTPMSNVVRLLSLLGGRQRRDQLAEAITCMKNLAPQISADSLLGQRLLQAYDLLCAPSTAVNPRFEWLDGVIVRAMEKGIWLVLDNANFCSASVLDRLNSVLERPDGFLSIHEHSGPDGEPRIVRPHPDFRIFLTMDPRYGELSRAMRNRSVEIFLEPSLATVEPYLTKITEIEASLQRYAHVIRLTREASLNGAIEVALLGVENLSVGDASLLSRYSQMSTQMFTDRLASPQDSKYSRLEEGLGALVSYVHSPKAASMRQAILQVYSDTSRKITANESLTAIQPLHTLHNAPILTLMKRHCPQSAEWFGFCFELFLEIQRTEQAIQSQMQNIDPNKLSSLNRLQRSLVSEHVALVAKDSTVNVAGFLGSIMQMIERFIGSSLQKSEENADAKFVLRALMHYWWRTFTFVTGTSFEEAKFQAHLKQGLNFFHALAASMNSDLVLPMIYSAIDDVNQAFAVGFKLTTGLSMETLWKLWRSTPVRDEATFYAVQEMEKLATRFDAIRWRSNAEIIDLSKAVSSLAEAYTIVRSNATTASDLLRALKAEIECIECNLDDSREVAPFFEHQFEMLRQALVIHRASYQSYDFIDMPEIVVLSNVPTVSQMRFQSWDNSERLLHSVDYILCRALDSQLWTGNLMASLLNRCDDAHSSANLFSLQCLDAELPNMGKVLAGASEAASSDLADCLNRILWHLMREVVGSQGSLLLQSFVSLFETLSQKLAPTSVRVEESGLIFELPIDELTQQSGCPDHLYSILQQHFVPAVAALVVSEKSDGQKNTFSSVAWIHFAIGCVKLYVPDNIFDPFLRAQTERNSHEEFLTSLRHKWQTLCAFQTKFTGQTSSLRAELLLGEIEKLGGPPVAATTVYRPSTDDLAPLQGEFNNVLNVIVKGEIASTCFRHLVIGSEAGAREVQLVKDNVLHLIERLTRRFPVYEDLTVPLVTILRCLQVGLNLGTASNSRQPSYAYSLFDITPMLGGSLWGQNSQVSAQSLEFLSYVGLFVSVGGIQSLDSKLRQSLFESLHYFYEEWGKKLDAEKTKEAIKNSLYRFRGGSDDEKEAEQRDFNELFPDYEAENGGSTSLAKGSIHATRNLSITLAERHERIFLSPQDSQQSLLNFCKSVARKFSSQDANSTTLDAEGDRSLLPAALLVLEERMDTFMSSTTSGSYNFYKTANVVEARKLIKLVQSIRRRFRELQCVDEISHLEPLADIINGCEHVLELKCSDPLAKMIIRIEKLHALVNEWQNGGWASQIHGALGLHNKLTETIVSWRRLELMTWANLFDMEREKCRADAKSWWFVAYHAVIAIPISKMDMGRDLQGYTIQLVSDLEMFFSEAVLGEFHTRLRLLRQLSSQLELLVLDYPALGLIHNAVLNFISMYRRYETRVTEAIGKSRLSMEQDMKEILLLASWKDTNIFALRESARKSHQKLFKLVRRFRDCLNQPLRSVIDQGILDEFHAGKDLKGQEAVAPRADEAAHAMCQQLIPGWLQDAHTKRLSKVDKIISIMAKVSELPGCTVQAAEVVENFVVDTMSTMSSLRRETPAFLTEENKEYVKHLKIRKIRLFDETLKTIRTMGFTRNLNETHVRNQKQLAAVMAKLTHLPSEANSRLAEIEYYFHKVLELAPQVRNSLHEHHGDLTNKVVRRSSGYMEGILHVLIQQHDCLAGNSQRLASMDDVLACAQALVVSFRSHDIALAEQASNHEQVLRWLVPVLTFGLHLIEVHARLGKIDNKIVQGTLRDWLAEFAELQSRFEACQKLPDGFDSKIRLQLRGQLQEKLKDFEAALQLLASDWPGFAFVFQQLQLWTTITVDHDRFEAAAGNATVYFDQTLNLSKMVLDAVQKFQKRAQSMPKSTEEAQWLLQYNDTLRDMLTSLHMNTIVDGISSSISALKSLRMNEHNVKNAALSLLAVTMPLFQQYVMICRRAISDLADLHCASSKMALNFGKAFVDIAVRGFCTPQESLDETSGDGGNLEGGTGLGEGQGTEDISKDIQPEEDLSELAQEPNQEKQDDIEKQEVAIDMGQDDMEGETGSASGQDNDDDDGQGHKDAEEEGQEEMDEEAGSVNDLDPTAVDEKMWDGDDEDADKDQQGDDARGQRKVDEQTAADDRAGSKDKPKDESEQKPEQKEEEVGPKEDDGSPQEELNRHDPDGGEDEVLALPDDMDIDAEEEQSDTLSDVQEGGEEVQKEADESKESMDEGDGNQGDLKEQEDMEKEVDAGKGNEDMQDQKADMDEKRPEPEPDEEGREELGELDEEEPTVKTSNDAHVGPDRAPVSDVKSAGGQSQNSAEEEEQEQSKAKVAMCESGEVGQNADDQEMASGKEGAISRRDEDQNVSQEGSQQDDSSQTQPFRKLGDACERWHRKQQNIKEAIDNEEAQQHEDSDMGQKEFQHIHDDNDAPNAQALDTAAEDEVQPIDESTGIDEDKQDKQGRRGPQKDDDDDKMDVDGEVESGGGSNVEDPDIAEREEDRGGVVTRRGAFEREREGIESWTRNKTEEREDERLAERCSGPDGIPVGDVQRPLRDYNQALQCWTSFQMKTQSLSLALSSQLRLILAPSQSTKLSGSYRTGKRLNIKKMIPYIASSYKRDKIWMRRAVPTKRTYQILLCVDDSESMGLTTAGMMALESLVMVSRALAMLEVGQVGVLGFGSDVYTAHELTAPLMSSHDAGAKILQSFTFGQHRTDVSLLMRCIIDQFRQARSSTGSRTGREDLWQLALVLSDGETPSDSHERIRRLLREALEERIMIVFIVMDDRQTRKGNSVLQLSKAKFVQGADGGSEVIIERYLDTFPFQYYLIVHNLEELPVALAGLLRTWFAEVAL